MLCFQMGILHSAAKSSFKPQCFIFHLHHRHQAATHAVSAQVTVSAAHVTDAALIIDGDRQGDASQHSPSLGQIVN